MGRVDRRHSLLRRSKRKTRLRVFSKTKQARKKARKEDVKHRSARLVVLPGHVLDYFANLQPGVEGSSIGANVEEGDLQWKVKGS